MQPPLSPQVGPGRQRDPAIRGRELRMEFDDVFPLLVLALLAALILAAKAAFDARALRVQLAGLREKYWLLDHRLVRLAELQQPPAAPPIEPTPAAEPAAVPPEPEPAIAMEEPVDMAGEPAAA